MTTLQVRIWDEDKKSAQELFKSFWMDLSTAIRVFLKTSIKNKAPAFNFHWITENGFTPEFEKNILKEVEEAKKSWKKYSSSDELFADVLWSNWKW